MTKYNTFNVKLSNSQLNKLKSGIKNCNKVTLNLSSNLIGNSNDGTSFPYKLSLTDTQVSRTCKAFPNGWLVNIKLSKTQLSKMQSWGFPDLLLQAALAFMFKVAKIVVINDVSVLARKATK